MHYTYIGGYITVQHNLFEDFIQKELYFKYGTKKQIFLVCELVKDTNIELTKVTDSQYSMTKNEDCEVFVEGFYKETLHLRKEFNIKKSDASIKNFLLSKLEFSLLW